MNEVNSLQNILDQLYGQMLTPFTPLIDVAKALGALGALCFVALRVWGHIARAETVELYPLLRPFVLGLAIFFYTPLLVILNGMLQPTVTGTAQILQGSDTAIATLLQQRQNGLQGQNAANSLQGQSALLQGQGLQGYAGGADTLGNDLQFALSGDGFSMDNLILAGLSKFMEILYEGAALVIEIIRAFTLVVLSIMGPLVIGLSTFDGFRHSLQHWLARYINVFLWLPVANIYGCIIGRVQELMLQQDGGAALNTTGATYTLFLLMGIAGYCCVPSTANYIVQAAGGHPLLAKINSVVTKIIV